MVLSGEVGGGREGTAKMTLTRTALTWPEINSWLTALSGTTAVLFGIDR